jgi:hypothetical protein
MQQTRGHGGTALASPRHARLSVVGGDPDEAVLRRKQFERAHPEIVITPPGSHSCLWTACRDGKSLAGGYQLSVLLDTLDWLLAE